MSVCRFLNNKTRSVGGILVFAFSILFINVVLMGQAVFAENGAEIIKGNVINKWSGSGSSDCSDPMYGRYGAGCQGYSWAFYASTGTVGDMMFRPDMTANDWPQRSADIYIPQTCSEHTDDHGGFWHFGQNAQSISSSGVSYFGNYMYVNGVGGNAANTYTYSTVAGSNGHMFTTSYKYGRGNLVFPALSPVQTLYKDGAAIYSLDRFDLGLDHSTDESASNVWKDWLTAYKYKYGEDYTESDFPDDLYIFCFWGSMNEEYYGRSNVSNGIAVGSTYFVEATQHKMVELTEREVIIPEDQTSVKVTGGLRFSHAIYSANKDEEKTDWTVALEFSTDGVTTTRTNTPDAVHSGSTKLDNPVAGITYFQPPTANTKFQDGNDYYVSRDVYDLTFTKEGEYTFCQSLSMKNKKVDNTVTKVCAKYKVKKEKGPPCSGPDCGGLCDEWMPASYTASSETSGTSSVVSKVNNVTIGTGYQDSVYAKPTDNPQWIHCYYPGAQMVAFSEATMIHGAHDSSLGKGGTTTNTNLPLSSFVPWSNYLQVTSKNFRNPTPSYLSYATGDSEVKTLRDDPYKVEYGSGKNKAGKTLVETAKAGLGYASVNNEGKHSWACDYYVSESCSHCGSYSCSPCTTTDGKTTCSKCCYSCNYSHSQCHHSNDYISHRQGGTVSDHADALVPFNFINTATIELADLVILSGETATIKSSEVQIRTRSNNVTKGTYATNVQNAKVAFYAYLSSSSGGSPMEGVGSGKSFDICSLITVAEDCLELDSRNNIELNPGGVHKLGSAERTTAATDNLLARMGANWNAFDAKAGKYHCVVAAVYPFTVMSDTDMNQMGSNNWYVSAPSCVIIAKKPTLQVWGNSLYTNGNIYTITSEKRITKGFHDLTRSTSKDASKTTIFGSWVEASIVANAQIDGMASGAATGYSGSTTRTWASGLGGSLKSPTGSKVCVYGPLTMPNMNCLSGGIPGASSVVGGGAGAKMSEPVDREALIARFDTEDGTFTLKKGCTSLSACGLGSVIPAGQDQTYVIDAGGKNFTIEHNIQYEDYYNSYVDIPKLIIRADNITIACNVTRIDAVIIADKRSGGSVVGKVNTCNSDVTSSANSNQLKINGAVITGSLLANRTYGNGAGAYSVIPAEIINYDSTLYLWGMSRANAEASGKLDTVYIQELSPRL